MDVLDRMEKVPPDPATDRPTRPIKLLDVQVFTDPFEAYKERLQKRLARERDAADVDGAKRQAREAREQDRTTWTGLALGEKQSRKVPDKPASLASAAAPAKAPGVGKYLGAATAPSAKRQAEAPLADAAADEAGGKKKRKAAGGFGDFSGW
jgi:peptidyl-prolyl cis-trans isomerase-like protein 2